MSRTTDAGEDLGRRLAGAACALRRSYEGTSGLDVLDVVFAEGHRGESLSFGGQGDPRLSLAWPTKPFGQILAAAFDRGMEPSDWSLIDRPEPELRTALLSVWTEEVLPSFARRYGLLSVTL